MSEKKTESDNTLSIFAIPGIIAPVLFALIVLILGFLEPGYSHLNQAISELGQFGASNAMAQNVNFIITGSLVLVFTIGLHRGIAKGSVVGPLLIAVFAIFSAIGNGFVPCDPACHMDDPNSRIHNMLGLIGFVSAIIGLFVISKRLRRDNLWKKYGSYSIISGVLALLFLLIFIVGSAALRESLPFLRGTFQRLMAGTLLLWVEVMAIRLYQVSRR